MKTVSLISWAELAGRAGLGHQDLFGAKIWRLETRNHFLAICFPFFGLHLRPFWPFCVVFLFFSFASKALGSLSHYLLVQRYRIFFFFGEKNTEKRCSLLSIPPAKDAREPHFYLPKSLGPRKVAHYLCHRSSSVFWALGERARIGWVFREDFLHFPLDVIFARLPGKFT